MHDQIIAKIRSSRMAYATFVISVVAVYAAGLGYWMQTLPAGAVARLVGLGLLFVGVGTYGFVFCELRQSGWLSILYFLIQFALVGLIGVSGKWYGLVWLLPIFLVSHTVVLLPRGGVIVAVALTVLLPVVLLGEGRLEQALSIGFSMLAAAVFVSVFTDVALRERRARAEGERLGAELAAANARLREYAVQAEELATINERNRLAREIHDGLGHYLTAIHMQLQAAQAVLAADPERAGAALGKAQHLAEAALADVRRSVAALRAAPTEGRSLPEALAELVEASRVAGFKTEFTIRGEERSLAPPVELTLYRAVQEGLTNARKHSAATRISVSLDYSRLGWARVVVLDNGQGAAETDAGGFGLLGLRERVQLQGGALRAVTAPGQGFQLEVEVAG